jgi:hypothetical protein
MGGGLAMSQKEERSSLHLISAEPNPLILFVPIFRAKILQTVRKLRGTSSAAQMSRPVSEQSGENHENSLSARLYGVSPRVFARSA